MPSLKDLRNRIASVKSTQKITKAMQMVAVSKLRRAQSAVEAARPYARASRDGARQSRRRRRRRARRRRRCSPAPAPTRPICWSSAPASAASAAPSTPRSCAWRASAPMRSRPRARRSRFSASARRATTSFAAPMRRRSSNRSICAACARSTFATAQPIAKKRARAVRGRRVRRLHAVLRALQVGDLADSDRPAARFPPSSARATRPAPVYDYEPDESEILTQLLPRAVTVRIYRALLENTRLVLRRADERDGQRDAQRRRDGEEIHASLQPHPPGDDHQGTDRNHFGRRGALTRPAASAAIEAN